jgi:hypothetical protein
MGGQHIRTQCGNNLDSPIFHINRMPRHSGVLATLAAAGICGAFAFVYHWRQRKFDEEREANARSMESTRSTTGPDQPQRPPTPQFGASDDTD